MGLQLRCREDHGSRPSSALGGSVEIDGQRIVAHQLACRRVLDGSLILIQGVPGGLQVGCDLLVAVAGDPAVAGGEQLNALPKEEDEKDPFAAFSSDIYDEEPAGDTNSTEIDTQLQSSPTLDMHDEIFGHSADSSPGSSSPIDAPDGGELEAETESANTTS